MALGIEALVVRKIEADIRGIKYGTKKSEDLNTYQSLEKLKTLNDGLYDELLNKYYDVKRETNNSDY